MDQTKMTFISSFIRFLGLQLDINHFTNHFDKYILLQGTMYNKLYKWFFHRIKSDYHL